jgi:ABC-2 type transport system ATP-binding protein
MTPAPTVAASQVLPLRKIAEKNDAVVRAQELSKWYGQVIGLNDVSLEIPRGITGLLGPNGAGKSTFLKLCTGLIRPSKGSVTVLGQDPWNNPRLLQRVGLAPEHDTFYENMTGLAFVTLLARMQGHRKHRAERLARDALEQVKLTPNINRRIATYSKGMRQRVKIAQTLVHDPELLFLDEPLTGTDPVGRREMIDFVKGLAKAGKSIVVSSHVLYEVEAMTQNILLIHLGRVIAEGDVHQIRDLIDEHPHNVRIEVDRPRDLAARLVALPGVVTVRVPDAKFVEAETRQPDAFYQQLQVVLQRDQFHVVSLTSPDDNLESVFRYLVK